MRFALRKATHRALAAVTADIEKLHFNVCVAHIYEFANTLNAVIGDMGSQDGADLGAETGAIATPDFRWAMREAISQGCFAQFRERARADWARGDIAPR